MKKNLDIIVTEKCNLRCKYCFYLNKSSISNDEIDFDKICKLIHKLKNEVELDLLTITGGEPFLYKNLRELIEFCKPLCRSICILTNGTLLNETNMEYIVKNNVILDISVDSIDKEYVEEYRGGYDSLINSFEILKKHNYNKLVITCSLNKNNLEGLHDLKIFAKSNNAILSSNLIDNSPRYQLDEEFILSNEVFKKFFFNTFDDSRQFKWKLLQYLVKRHKIKNCIVRKKSIVVDVDGKIYTCLKIKEPVGTYDDDIVRLLSNIEKFNSNDFICKYTSKSCYGLF